MKKEKIISQHKIGIIYAAISVIMIILGCLTWYLCDPKVVYDLPIFLWFFAALSLGIAIKKIGFEKDKFATISRKTMTTFFTSHAIQLALVALIIVIIIKSPNFMQIRVVLDIFAQSSTRLIIALGICFTLLIGGTDLSAGRMVGLAAVISASMLQNADYSNRFFPNLPQLAVFIPIIIAIIACMLFGALNGFLVAKFNMHPFIATLATQVIIYGVCSLYFDMPPNNSQPIGGLRSDFAAIGQSKLLKDIYPGFPGISILIPIALLITLLIWFILNNTTFGKNVYAIGGNREAAVVSGVNVFATLICIFVLAAAMYGVGGVLEAARTAGATNQYGNGYELDAIAACVVGGVSLNGGVGKVSGIIVGVLIFTVIQYGLQFIGVSPMWQQVIKGVIIATAVALDMKKYQRN